MPTVNLQPGSTNTAAVKQLQQFLVQNGYMTQAQVDTGFGTYGPKTTAAVAALQKDLGVDNSTGVGYFGPRTIAAVQSKVSASSTPPAQTSQTPGQMTTEQMRSAVTKALAANPDYQTYGGGNDPAAVLDASLSGDWSGVVSLTGKPFTDEEQKAAVAQAESALGPVYREQEANDRAQTEDQLRQTQEGFQDSQNADKKSFGQDKATLDTNAADQGILFSGARVQKMNDLRNTYADREALARRGAAENLTSTARGYQYAYGNDAARGLSDLYKLPGASTFNTSTGGVRSGSVSSAYDPSQNDFYGTQKKAQNVLVQGRATDLLKNKANKLSISGLNTQF